MCLAVPGQLIGIWGADLERCGLVDFGSVRREVGVGAWLTRAAREGQR